ncbi:hypothetical protein U2718_014335 [Chlorogloeopsis sp. ULAP02]
MFPRLVLISIFILTISVVLTRNAYAQTTETCIFSQTVSGELVGDGGTLPTQLVSFSTAGGSPTQISVHCEEPVNLSVSEPIQIAGPAFQPVSSLVTVETANGGSTNSRSGSPLSLPVGTTPVVINLFVDKGSLLAPGNYRYGIKFTIVP